LEGRDLELDLAVEEIARRQSIGLHAAAFFRNRLTGAR